MSPHGHICVISVYVYVTAAHAFLSAPASIKILTTLADPVAAAIIIAVWPFWAQMKLPSHTGGWVLDAYHACDE